MKDFGERYAPKRKQGPVPSSSRAHEHEPSGIEHHEVECGPSITASGGGSIATSEAGTLDDHCYGWRRIRGLFQKIVDLMKGLGECCTRQNSQALQDSIDSSFDPIPTAPQDVPDRGTHSNTASHLTDNQESSDHNIPHCKQALPESQANLDDSALADQQTCHDYQVPSNRNVSAYDKSHASHQASCGSVTTSSQEVVSDKDNNPDHQDASESQRLPGSQGPQGTWMASDTRWLSRIKVSAEDTQDLSVVHAGSSISNDQNDTNNQTQHLRATRGLRDEEGNDIYHANNESDDLFVNKSGQLTASSIDALDVSSQPQPVVPMLGNAILNLEHQTQEIERGLGEMHGVDLTYFGLTKTIAAVQVFNRSWCLHRYFHRQAFRLAKRLGHILPELHDGHIHQTLASSQFLRRHRIPYIGLVAIATLTEVFRHSELRTVHHDMEQDGIRRIRRSGAFGFDFSRSTKTYNRDPQYERLVSYTAFRECWITILVKMSEKHRPYVLKACGSHRLALDFLRLLRRIDPSLRRTAPLLNQN
jgi:hypothetical protein